MVRLIKNLLQLSLVRNIIAASSGNVIFFGSQLLRNFFLARVLGPLGFGVWNFGLVLLQYAQWSHLGILNAFRLDGPRNLGAGNVIKFSKLRQLTWSMCVFPPIVIFVGALLIIPFVQDHSLRNSVWMMAISILPFQLYLFISSSLATQEKFASVARLQSFLSVTNLLLTLVLAYQWKFWGAIAAQVVSYAVAIFVTRSQTTIWCSPLLEKYLFREQAKIGLPLWINGILFGLFISIDRVLINFMLGAASLGQYALASMARSSIGLIPAAISEVIYIRASTQHGDQEKSSANLPLILLTDRLFAYIGIIPIGFGIIWAAPTIQFILPAYQPGIAALQIYLMGLFFTLPINSGNFLNVVGRASQVTMIMGVTVILQSGLIIWGIRSWGIEGAAFATLLSSAFYFLAINWWGLHWSAGSLATLIQILKCVTPWLGTIFALLTSKIIFSIMHIHLSPFIQSMITTIIFLLIISPIIYHRLSVDLNEIQS